MPGRNTGISLGSDYSLVYGFDDYGRFNGLSWQQGSQSGVVSYNYLANTHLLESITSTAGITTSTTYGYEPHRNLKTSVSNIANSALISAYTYSYDSLGRRENVANTGSAFGSPAFSTYGYNDRNELIDGKRYLGSDLTDTSAPVEDEQRAYIYDPIGNRLTADKGAGTSLEMIDYQANALNQYQSITGGSITSPSYDDDGNLIGYTEDGQQLQLSFNAENRLIAIAPVAPVAGETRSDFVYDYMGRRVQKNISSWDGSSYQPSSTSRFIYDGWNMIRELDGSGQSTASYIYGLDLSQSLQGAGGVGGILARIDHSTDTVYNYFYDANGNVGQLVDADSAALAASYEYDPYGNVVASSGALADSNPFRFSSKYFDGESGLYYYGYRYYSPDLGRWLNRDPMGEGGGLNTYAFVANNPLLFIDPTGLYGIDIHLGLTHYLAINAGCCEAAARELAQADQAVDSDLETNPAVNYLKNLSLEDGANSPDMRQAMKPHFPIDPNNLNPSAVVLPNSPFVQGLVAAQIATGSVAGFGGALHTYQDSWSHQGYRNSHLKPNGMPDSRPDNTSLPQNVWVAFDMARSTYLQMSAFIRQNPQCHCPEDFNELERFVLDYIRQKDKHAKERMLRDSGLEDYARPDPLCSSCAAFIGLSGDSEEAQKRREKFADSVLNSSSPEGCGYYSTDRIFGWCAHDNTKINKRVKDAREKMIVYFYQHPLLGHTEIFDRIIIDDLYYCRDEKGGLLPSGEVIMYCETQLSSGLEKKFSRNNIEYLGPHNELFKYSIKLE